MPISSTTKTSKTVVRGTCLPSFEVPFQLPPVQKEKIYVYQLYQLLGGWVLSSITKFIIHWEIGRRDQSSKIMEWWTKILHYPPGNYITHIFFPKDTYLKMMIFPNFPFVGICIWIWIFLPGGFSSQGETKQPNKSGALMLDNLSATERAVEAARWSGFFLKRGGVGWMVGWRYGIFMAMREIFSYTPWIFNSLPIHIVGRDP